MRWNRATILKVFEDVSIGLAKKELIPQSSCFVFDGTGNVLTYNDELCCRYFLPDFMGVKGAVKAAPLLGLLGKLQEDVVDVTTADGELRVKGKGRRAGVPMEVDVLLPVEGVEVPEEWRPLGEDFVQAASVVHGCGSAEESRFVLTCVHITPTFLEACDGFQIARFPVDTGVPRDILVRKESLRRIVGLDMKWMAETGSWLHFKNDTGLTVSTRRYLDDYPNLDDFLRRDGLIEVALPGGLEEAVSRAEIFSADNSSGNYVLVELRDNWMQLEGRSVHGWFQERKEMIGYNGPPIRFLIAPMLLVEISKKAKTCGVSATRLFVDGGRFVYTTSTRVPDQQGT